MEDEAYFKQALDSRPNYGPAHYNLAKVYLTQNKVDMAKQELETVVRVDPSHGVGLFQEQQEGDTKDFADAEAHLRKAIELKSDFAEAHFRLGLLFSAQGRIADSLGEFLRACEFDPEMPEAHYHLGLAYSKLGEKEKAEKEFRLQHRLRAETAEK